MIKLIPIKNYENYYSIDINGNIFSHRTDKILKHTIGTIGYPTVNLSVKGKRKQLYVHRLLAIHFIPNPNNYSHVNHINGNRNDYSISNLEWCTHAYNKFHAYETGLIIPQRHGNRKIGKYRGVYWKSSLGKWCSEVRFKSKSYHVGTFTNEEDAFLARKCKITELGVR